MCQKRFSSPVHPGELLKEEFLNPLGISSRVFAEKTEIPPETIDKIIAGREGITKDIAFRFSEILDTHPEMWIKLQNSYDQLHGSKKSKSGKKDSQTNGSDGIHERPVDRHERS